MRRRDLLAGFAATGALPIAARAQIDRVRVVGLLSAVHPTASAMFSVFTQRLQELGWTQGNNLRIEVRHWTSGERKQLMDLARELVELTPDVVVARSSPEISAIHAYTRTVPIVFPFATDPVASGFVSNLARPGGNITGFMNFEHPMAGKWLEILKDIAPAVKRVSVVHNPDNVATPGYLEALKPVAEALQIELALAAIRQAGDIHALRNQGGSEGSQGLILLPDFIFSRQAIRDGLITAVREQKLPAVYPFVDLVREGGLASYAASYTDLWQRTAEYVDLILRGAKVADLPVQVPTKFVLTINLKTAKALGLSMPQWLLARADEVIE